MLKIIKEWFELRRLEKSKDRIENRHAAIRRSQDYKKDSPDKRASIESDMASEWFEIHESIESILTKKILRLANKYRMPVPSRLPEDGNRYWERGDFGDYYLNLEGYNKIKNAVRDEKKARREERLFWTPLISVLGVLIAGLTTLYTISNYQLNEKINVAEVGLNFNNSTGLVMLKNYGKLPATQFNLVGSQIEFAEKPNSAPILKAGTGISYSTQDIVVPIKILTTNFDKHIQFLVFVWSYDNGKKNICKDEILIRTPSEPYWVPTTQSFVIKSQWGYLVTVVNGLKSELIKK